MRKVILQVILDLSSIWKLFEVLGFLFFHKRHKAEENRNYCMTKVRKFSLLYLVYATQSQQEIYKLSFCHILRPGEVLIWILRYVHIQYKYISQSDDSICQGEQIRSGLSWQILNFRCNTTSRYRSQSDKLKWIVLRRTTCRLYKQQMFAWFD